MTNPMPNSKEMLESYLKFYRDIAVLFRHLNGSDPKVAQESSDVLQQLGTCAVPYLVYQLNGSKNRDLSLRIIEVFEKIGPPAWEVALPQLYPTLKENADPVVSARLIEAFKCLTPYQPPIAGAERPMHQSEQPPRPGSPPDEASDPLSGVGSSSVGRTSASAGRPRHREKATRKGRSCSDDPLIGGRVPHSKSQLDC